MNPFNGGTQMYNVYSVLQDYEWHCTKCELPAAQAATFRDMINRGVIFDKDANGNNFKRIYCDTCNATRVHRKLAVVI